MRVLAPRAPGGRPGRHPLQQQRQRGVAVITALLLTTLAVTIVASLFWQQQVQVRAIENQRMQLQKQWILRGALDWARLILSESYKSSPNRDDLQQPWSVGLAETRLDSYVENGRSDSEASEAKITGKIIDAQSYLNLAGLSQRGIPVEKEIMAFERLLTTLRIDPALAKAAAAGMAAGQPKEVTALPGSNANTNAGLVSGATAATQGVAASSATAAVSSAPAHATGPLAINQVDDLLAVPGFTPEIIAKLKNFVIILPRPTPVNINTASAEVLAARIGTLPLQGAQSFVVGRDRTPLISVAEIANRFPGQPMAVEPSEVSVRTDFFIVDGKVKLNRAGLEVLALIERIAPRPAGLAPSVSGVVSKVLWVREN